MAYIKRRISKDLIWIEGGHYPFRADIYREYRYRVLLGVGGNIGDTVRRFDKLYHYLSNRRDMSIIETSPILKNPPFGYLKQDFFYNALIEISTDLIPVELLKRTQMTERLFGRVKNFKDGPRTLDIDIIFHSLGRVEREFLKIPHPGWQERESVILPMSRMKGESWSKRHL